MKKLFTFFLVFLYHLNASALDLGIPVACDYGVDCLISSYYDKSIEPEKFTDQNIDN